MTVRFLRFTLLARSVFAACYYPDGSVAQDTPCTDGTVQSSCCGTGYACLGHSSSFFLCQATGSEFQKPGATQYVRGSCTDKTWRSANCPNVCVNPDRDNTGGGHGLAQCPLSNTLFYCISTGSGVENCSTGFNLVNLLGTLPPCLGFNVFLVLLTSLSHHFSEALDFDNNRRCGVLDNHHDHLYIYPSHIEYRLDVVVSEPLDPSVDTFTRSGWKPRTRSNTPCLAIVFYERRNHRHCCWSFDWRPRIDCCSSSNLAPGPQKTRF